MAPRDARPIFPTYLLPTFTFPFRRRQSSTSSATESISPPSLSYSPNSSASTTPSSSPPNTYTLTEEIRNAALCNEPEKQTQQASDSNARLYRAQPNTLKCITCSSDVAFASQIVSKGFTGRHGRAYLVSLPPIEISMSGNKIPGQTTTMLPNTKIGRSVNRELLTGQHVVADVSCTICGSVLGWKYLDAKEAAQKYKIGKYILEMKRVVLAVAWEDSFEGEDEVGVQGEVGKVEEDDDVVVFDSEDEDECDELFAGSWDPEVVAKRRGKRTWTRKKAGMEV